MATIEEIEAQAVKDAEYIEVEEIEEGDIREDFWEATTLLAKSRTLLEFMSDRTLCKGLTNRERESMTRLAEQLTGFLDEVEGKHDMSELEDEEF